MARGAPYQAADAGDQLGHLERLGEIVVRTRFDTLDFLGPVRAGRQNQNRQHAIVRAPFLKDRQTVKTRQPKIEDGNIVIFDIALEPGVVAIASEIDDEPSSFQCSDNIRSNIGIVFDHQCPHSVLNGNGSAGARV